MTVADPGTVLAELQSADRLLVQQVFKPIANEYRVSVPSPGSTDEGRPLLYVKQRKRSERTSAFVSRPMTRRTSS